MGDKRFGAKSSLSDSFPEINELLKESDQSDQLRSKNINRKNIEEDTGCKKTFELCKVLQDPKDPEEVTIVKETFSAEIRSSVKNSDNEEAKSNRYIYCKEIIKPYVESENENDCNPDVLLCDALEAAAADFPSFQYCCQQSPPERGSDLGGKSNGNITFQPTNDSKSDLRTENKSGSYSDSKPKPESDSKSGSDSKYKCESKCKPKSESGPKPASQPEPKSESDSSKCIQKCYDKGKVGSDAVVAVTVRKKLYFTDKSNICKKNNGKSADKDNKKGQQQHKEKFEVEPCEKIQRAPNIDPDNAHCKTVATLKLAAQDMLSKAYTTMNTIVSSDDSHNRRMPQCAPEKPKKCNFENTQTTTSYNVKLMKNIETVDSSQNTTNIFDKALSITKSAVNKICSFHSLLILDSLAQYKDYPKDRTCSSDDSNCNLRKRTYENDIAYNGAEYKINDATEPKNSDKTDENRNGKAQTIAYYNNKSPSSFLIENRSTNNNDEESFNEGLGFHPSKLKFYDHNVPNVVIDENKIQDVANMENEEKGVENTENISNTNTVAKKIKGAGTTIKDYLEETKDTLSDRIGGLKEKIWTNNKEKEENEEPAPETKLEDDSINVTGIIIDSINTAKNTARIFTSTGVEIVDKIYSSTTSLIPDGVVKTVSDNEPEEEDDNEEKSTKKNLEELTANLMKKMSSTAAHISKKVEEKKNRNVYDIPMPNPRDVSADSDDPNSDFEKMHSGVFDSLKSKLYSMFYDNDLSTIHSESSSHSNNSSRK